MGNAPHYLREYRRLLGTLRKKHGDEETALRAAVGGDYEKQGSFQRDLVLKNAPDGAFTLIDVGCGSGRAAFALRDEERLTYHGVDILPDLLAYAREQCDRDDWTFQQISEIGIPFADQSADMTLFMSVFTHLTPDEIGSYLAESARVLKPGGVMICSYLDRDFEAHRKAYRPAPLQRIGRWLGRDVMLSFTTKAELTGWVEAAGFTVENVATFGSSPGQHTMAARRISGTE